MEGWGAIVLIAFILYKLRIPGILDVTMKCDCNECNKHK